MARINQASLRAQLDDCRAQFDAIKQKGEASADTLALIHALFMLVDIVVAVFLEKTTPKTSRNSSLPSSRDGTDEGETHTAGRSGSRGPKARHARSDTLRTVTTTPHRGQVRIPEARTEGTPPGPRAASPTPCPVLCSTDPGSSPMSCTCSVPRWSRSSGLRP